MFYNIKYGMKNIVKWLPVIWKDRDWDSYHIFKLLHFKLSNMEKLFRVHGNHVESSKDADDIKICINLLNRILKNEYGEMVFKNHDEKWGEPKFSWETIDKQECMGLNIIRENVTVKNEEQERKEFKELIKREDILKKQDINYLFNYLAKHIRNWWD